MLNFRNVIIVSLLLLLCAFLFDIFYGLSNIIYIGIILAATPFMVYGSVSVKSGFYIKTLCSSSVKKNEIAITFDDGPDENLTPEVLKILNDKNVKASFFVIGLKAEKNSLLLKKIVEQGHLLACHSYNHSNYFDLYSTKRMIQEISETEDIVLKLTGKKMMMFRPPYGVTNPNLAKALKKKNYYVIGWSIRSKDTVIKDEEELYSSVINQVKGGDIILFHDTQKIMVSILPRLIDSLKAKGYDFTTVDKLLDINAYRE